MPEIKFNASAENLTKLINATLWRLPKTDNEMSDAEWARKWWRKQMVKLVNDHEKEKARTEALNNIVIFDDDSIS